MTHSLQTRHRASASAIEAPVAGATKPLAVRLPEAARISGFSRSRLYRMAGDGELTFLKCGKATLVEYASLEAAIHRLPRITVKAAA
jgi:hypothetical protein